MSGVVSHRIVRAVAVFLCLAALLLSGLFSGRAWADPKESHAVRVPILMYHYVRTVTNPLDRAGFDLSVTPLHFSQQMGLLSENGFQTVTLDDLLAAMFDGASLPAKPLILTFDDGYEDFYTTAFPILKKYGFHATSFIITGKVGQAGYMTWAQIRELEKSGLVQFEAHTVDHADMGRMTVARAHWEMATSKKTLEGQLGAGVDYFAYPAGHYNAGVSSLLFVEGYRAGVGTQPGVWHSLSDLQALARVRIHGRDLLSTFAAKLGVSAK